VKHLKTLGLIAATTLALPGLALAADDRVIHADKNDDGVLNLAEVQAVYPEITDDRFAEVDLNSDGRLEDAEVKAAQEAGLMPSG